MTLSTCFTLAASGVTARGFSTLQLCGSRQRRGGTGAVRTCICFVQSNTVVDNLYTQPLAIEFVETQLISQSSDTTCRRLHRTLPLVPASHCAAHLPGPRVTLGDRPAVLPTVAATCSDYIQRLSQGRLDPSRSTSTRCPPPVNHVTRFRVTVLRYQRIEIDQISDM